MASWTLGIDPSASKQGNGEIGWALFRDKDLIEIGDLIPDPPFFSRVRQFCRNKFKMIYTKDSGYKICVAVESVYLGSNANIFMGLIQCQSHICAVTLDSGHSFRFISPLTSFQCSTGLKQYPLNEKGTRSKTRKPAIQAAVKSRYGLPEDTSEHICDALALAEVVIQGK